MNKNKNLTEYTHKLAISPFYIKNSLHGTLGPITIVNPARVYWRCSVLYAYF